ncbi:MAG: peptidylprolyl isomerase [Candidatus Dadabacteria bacterium]|nr:MAG: peptidylprolyl isomerase [Candidatus Dadabacteria bacterium]
MRGCRWLVLLAVAGLVSACSEVVPEEVETRLANEKASIEAHDRAVRELLVLDTDRGRLIFRLFPDEAPNTVTQVRAWVEDGVWDGTWFHRVVTKPVPFVIQGGDPDTRMQPPATDPAVLERQAATLGFGTTDPVLPPERTIRRHTAGALALAVAHDGSRAGPQFVISLARLPHLDGAEPVFGQLVGGWSVLQQIRIGDRIQSARLIPPERIDGDWHADVPPPELGE